MSPIVSNNSIQSQQANPTTGTWLGRDLIDRRSRPLSRRRPTMTPSLLRETSFRSSMRANFAPDSSATAALAVISRGCCDVGNVAETSLLIPKALQRENSAAQLCRRVQIGSAKTQFQAELDLGKHGSQVRCAGSARRGNAIRF